MSAGDLVISDLTLDAIRAEAIRAHKLHGVNSMLSPTKTHDRRFGILTEEVGEVARELNECDIHEGLTEYRRVRLVTELIQVAAMAASWIEVLEG